MDPAEIEKRVCDALGDCEVHLEIDGNKAGLMVTATAFEGLSRVQRQQRVYGALGDLISSGQLHAVTMRCQTPDEVS
ncbi:MAG: hypothetical protein CMQ05_08100 [Gammaproteobacteria bacterium]|nr:hypothetical protein [Gammaproteobacteria bacterium]RPG27595.1 MAG: BolA/IbaG family iron-sulfur metabolism protein [Gammaproteobacteria bacterium TMED50]|tara:strand:+ start:2234 stop:2464 length:231 start_codon:yes stop_codon:yes gene_type:complete